MENMAPIESSIEEENKPSPYKREITVKEHSPLQ
jgi:hypothetical protein